MVGSLDVVTAERERRRRLCNVAFDPATTVWHFCCLEAWLVQACYLEDGDGMDASVQCGGRDWRSAYLDLRGGVC